MEPLEQTSGKYIQVNTQGAIERTNDVGAVRKNVPATKTLAEHTLESLRNVNKEHLEAAETHAHTIVANFEKKMGSVTLKRLLNKLGFFKDTIAKHNAVLKAQKDTLSHISNRQEMVQSLATLEGGPVSKELKEIGILNPNFTQSDKPGYMQMDAKIEGKDVQLTFRKDEEENYVSDFYGTFQNFPSLATAFIAHHKALETNDVTLKAIEDENIPSVITKESEAESQSSGPLRWMVKKNSVKEESYSFSLQQRGTSGSFDLKHVFYFNKEPDGKYFVTTNPDAKYDTFQEMISTISTTYLKDSKMVEESLKQV